MTALLKLIYFGQFRVEINGQVLTGFRSQKAQALLAYLALEGSQPCTRAHLAYVLWHGYQHKTALASVRVALANLRRLLAPLDVLRITRQSVQWQGAAPSVWSDVSAFTALLAPLGTETALAQQQAALALYTRDFLDGYETIDSQPFQQWLAERRTYYHTQVVQLRSSVSASPVAQTPQPAHNLPRTFTALIGRAGDVTAVGQLLLEDDHPLVTVLGEGGVGKTRLALAVAQSIYTSAVTRLQLASTTDGGAAQRGKPLFPDGVWYVSLAGVEPIKIMAPAAEALNEIEQQAEEAIANAIAKALGIPFAGVAPLRTQLCDRLQHKTLLLVLDNFEHLSAGRNLLVTLLQRAHGVKVLVTSRQRLYLQAEHIYHLSGLPVPNLATTSWPRLKVVAYPSIQLFVACARNTTAGFTLTPANLVEVAQICIKLEGVPLALELAAAQIEAQTPAQILHNLQTSLFTLSSDLVDVLPRHRDLRLVLATSWRLLTPTEAQILAQCAIFHGGFTLAAAAAVCANVAGGVAEQQLAGLIDKCLLQWADNERYHLHEVVRQYAAEQLQQDEQAWRGARHRHAHYFASLLHDGLAGIYTTPAAQRVIQADLDNIRSAWHWLVAEADWAALNQAIMPFALFQFYTGSLQEMDSLFGAALALLRPRLRPAGAANEWHAVGFLLALQAYFVGTLGRMTEAEHLAQEARQIGEQIADQEVQMLAYLALNLVARMQGRLDVPQAQTAVALAQRYADQPPHLIVQFMGDLGRALTRAGEAAAASTTYEAGLQLAQRYQVHLLGGVLLYLFSQLQARLGDWARLYQLTQAALTIHQTWGYFTGLNQTALSLAHYAYALGDYPQALQWAQQVLMRSRIHQAHEPELLALIWQSKAQAQLGQVGEAQKNLAQAVALSEKLGNLAHQTWVQVELGRVALQQNDWSTVAAAQQVLATLADQPAATEYRAASQTLRLLLTVHQGEVAAAGEQVASILALLADPQPLAQPYAAAWVYTICYQTLQARQDPQAQTVLAQAQAWLQAQAAKISDPTLQQVFLNNVPEHQLLAPPKLELQKT